MNNEELEYRRKYGWGVEFTLSSLSSELKRLGYRLDRSMDCKAISTWRTGERAGKSFPCISTGIKEIDTGKSAFHFEARRDKNFEALQAMRYEGTFVAMRNGYILEL